MMSTAFQSSGVALGLGHAQAQEHARRVSMLLPGSSRKSSSATAVSTFTPSSSLSSSTSMSSACPHTHRQNHNSSKLPTFRSADLNSSSIGSSALPSQQRAPDDPPSVSATAAGPAPGPPRRGPGSALGPANPQGPGQGLAAAAADGSIPGPAPDPQQDPPINHPAAAATPARPGPPPATRQARQSELHSTLPETVAAPGSGTLPRTRASTFIPSSISAPSATPTNNAAAAATSQPGQPTVKSAPPTKRSASLPTSALGAEHVSPLPDNDRANYSPATSPLSASPSPPAPATTAPPATIVPQTTERGEEPSVSPTTVEPPATTAHDTATSTNPATNPASFSRSQKSRRPPLSISGHPSPATPVATSLGTQRRHTYESAQSHRASTNWAPGQRELLLPKSLSLSSSSDDKRSSASPSYRPPPISYKAPPSLSASHSPATSASASPSPTVAGPVRVPPIRGFRSSVSRRSLVIDPASRPCQRASDGSGDENGDMGSREDTLRALEGRDASSGSGRANGADGDDTTDMFLNIAQQESVRPSIEAPSPKQDHGPISRVFRSSHKRPLSAAIPSYQPMSPPQVGRRHSDQRETLRSRGADEDDDDDPDRTIRGLPYNTFAREKAASAHPGEGLSRRATTTSFRSGSTTPRSLVSQQPGDSSAYTRRRTSISDAVGHRTTSYKQSNLGYGQYRSPVYNSSPLAPRPEPQQAADYGNGPEGTESTASTTGPSTVWDELDDLKSRINRLELTGKLPSTSGAAMSRVSDDRPYTANTTATNVSSSPKRNGAPAANGQQADASSIISAGQKESHPLLHQALAKSKALLGADAYAALETVAMDSLTLLTLMGSAGQPGPISSGASAIGTSGVTDRQLRRKADGMCRSITELCVALNEEYSRAPTFNFSAQTEGPKTPTLVNGFSGAAAQRRPSAMAEQTGLRVATSPRTMSKLEERRSNMLNSSSIPSPRVTTTPSLPTPTLSLSSLAPTADGVGRRSSLLISRRRAGTEEPDDGRRSSLLLRTRRAGTEDPEEGGGVRKTSLLLRPRRGTVGEDDERAPSRAGTEVPSARVASRDYSARHPSRDYSTPGASREYSTRGTSRESSIPAASQGYSTPGASRESSIPAASQGYSTPGASREYSTPVKDPSSLTSSALPRRRLGTSTASSSRFGIPSTPIPASARRYAEANGGGSAERSTEERTPVTRSYTIGQTALLNRTASVNRRANTSRESGMSTPGQGGPSQVSYR